MTQRMDEIAIRDLVLTTKIKLLENKNTPQDFETGCPCGLVLTMMRMVSEVMDATCSLHDDPTSALEEALQQQLRNQTVQVLAVVSSIAQIAMGFFPVPPDLVPLHPDNAEEILSSLVTIDLEDRRRDNERG